MKRFFSFLAGATALSTVLIGCSGSAELPINAGTPVIPVTGGVVQGRGTSNDTVSSQPTPQQVQVTMTDGPNAGNVVTATIPANTPVNAGDPLAVFEPGIPLITGLTTTGVAAAPSATRQGSFESGEVIVYMAGNSQEHRTGVFITRDGGLSRRLACPDGHFQIFLNGQFAVIRGGNRLDVRHFIFDIFVQNGRASLPINMDGELPVNGGSSFPLHLNVDLPTQFGDGFATLQVIHDNGRLRQTKRVDPSGFVQFHDFQFSETSLIPRVGVDSVEFDWSPTNPDNG